MTHISFIHMCCAALLLSPWGQICYFQTTFFSPSSSSPSAKIGLSTFLLHGFLVSLPPLPCQSLGGIWKGQVCSSPSRGGRWGGEGGEEEKGAIPTTQARALLRNETLLFPQERFLVRTVALLLYVMCSNSLFSEIVNNVQ